MIISISNFNGNRWLRVNGRYFGYTAKSFTASNSDTRIVGRFAYVNLSERSPYTGSLVFCLMVAVALSAATIVL